MPAPSAPPAGGVLPSYSDSGGGGGGGGSPAYTLLNINGNANDSRPPLSDGTPLLAETTTPPPSYADDVGCWVGWKREPHMKCFVLTASMIVVLVLFLTADEFDINVFYGVFFSLLALYFLECICADTGKYLNNMGDAADITQYHQQIVSSPPWILWHIECYHYETRTRDATRTITDSDGNTTTETYQETYQVRVRTHSASHSYELAGWRDTSKVLEPTSHDIAKVEFDKTYEWRDPGAKAKHDAENAMWISMNDRDVHKDVSWTWGINGYKSRLVSVRDGAEVPCCFDIVWYVLFSLIGLSWFYRVYGSSITGKRAEGFVKVGW